NVSSEFSLSGSCQDSHRPAIARSSWVDLKIFHGCLVPLPRDCHSKNPSAGTIHRRSRNAFAKAGFVATVSDRALIICDPTSVSFAQLGTRPHRNNDASRVPSPDCRATRAG